MLTIALTYFTDEEPEAQGEFTEPLLAMASGRAWDSDEVSLTEPRPLTFQVFRMLLSSPCSSRSWRVPGKSHGQKSLADCSVWGHEKIGHNLVTKQQGQGASPVLLLPQTLTVNL